MDKASNEYLRNAVLTASPEQLQLMLYDGAIRFTRQGIEGINKRDWEQAFNGLSRAQKIVLEMINSLNHDVDRELCNRMAGLYNFVYRKLIEAGTQRDDAVAGEALEILEYQRETWVMLMDKLKQERQPRPEPPRNPAEQPCEQASYGMLSVQG